MLKTATRSTLHKDILVRLCDAMVEHISSVWTELFSVPLHLHS